MIDEGKKGGLPKKVKGLFYCAEYQISRVFCVDQYKPRQAQETIQYKEARMTETKCCETEGGEQKSSDYEIVQMEKTKNVCPMCEDYAKQQASKPIAVMCCEGACLRGEVARRAANIVCHLLAPEKTVRICLGGAFTKKHRPKESGEKEQEGNCIRRLLH